MRILSAEYVLPISSPPIYGGAVVFDRSKIVEVGMRDVLVHRYPTADREELGRAAILPGLVNCHSHLEITAMRGQLDDSEHDFRTWLLKLNDIRSKMSEQEILASALCGASEGAAAGVTCFGDVGRFGKAGMEALKTAGLRGIVFQETEFSPDNSTAQNDLAALLQRFEKLQGSSTSLVEAGISPHSPYTVSRKLMEGIAEFTSRNKTKLAVHAAESDDECRLLVDGSGFFREIYRKFNIDWEVPRCTPIEFLAATGILETKPLLIHCVAANERDIELIAESGSRIAHCPKSNAKLGHGLAPLEKFLNTSIAVGLGSDSVASNNVCDILEESRFAALAARSHPERKRFMSADEMLRLATIGGARALGLGDRIGTLEAGKDADITAVSLDNIAQQPVNDINAALVFSSNARDVCLTIVAGCEVYRQSPGELDAIFLGRI